MIMTIAFTGGRNYSPKVSHMKEALSVLDGYLVDSYGDTEFKFIHGGAEGADVVGSLIALIHRSPATVFVAEWERLGKKAGPVRNSYMAESCDVCIAFPGGKGTENMKKQCRDNGKVVIEIGKS